MPAKLTAIYGENWNADHELKTHPQYFRLVWSGVKRYEVRKDDRNFQEGQSVLLEEYEPTQDGTGGTYTGRWILGTIPTVVRDVPHFGLNPGFCVFGFNEVFRSSHGDGN